MNDAGPDVQVIGAPDVDERAGDSRSGLGVASPYLSPAGVAVYLGIPIETIRAWRKRGKFAPAFKVGKLLRWRREDVDSWMREHLERSPSPGNAHVEYAPRALQRSCS